MGMTIRELIRAKLRRQKEKGPINEMSGGQRVRVELLCGMIEDPESEFEQDRWADTENMWEKAQGIADRMGFQTNFSQHESDGCLYGDAYVYPPVGIVMSVLDAFDEQGIEYDNIDISPDAPKELVDALEARYKNSHMVDINRRDDI